MISGFTEELMENGASSLGIEEFFTKPLDCRLLRKSVARAFDVKASD
jgi:hypothetical protein